MEPYELIAEHELVLAAFGQWPSFHDGEVHRIVLDRMSRSPSGIFLPTIELHVRGWIMTSQVGENGVYKVEHDSVVSFLFEDIFDLELEGFNHQNVLSSLNFTMDRRSTDKASPSCRARTLLRLCGGVLRPKRQDPRGSSVCRPT